MATSDGVSSTNGMPVRCTGICVTGPVAVRASASSRIAADASKLELWAMPSTLATASKRRPALVLIGAAGESPAAASRPTRRQRRSSGEPSPAGNHAGISSLSNPAACR